MAASKLLALRAWSASLSSHWPGLDGVRRVWRGRSSICGLPMAVLRAPSAPLSSTAHGGTLHSCQLSLTVEGLPLAKNGPALLNCGGAAAGIAVCIAVQLQRRGSPRRSCIVPPGRLLTEQAASRTSFIGMPRCRYQLVSSIARGATAMRSDLTELAASRISL